MSPGMDPIIVFGLFLLGITIVVLVGAVVYSLRVQLPIWLDESRERAEQKRLAEEEAALPPEADPPTVLLLPPRGFSIIITEQVGAADFDPLRPLPSPADLPVRTKGNRRLQAGTRS